MKKEIEYLTPEELEQLVAEVEQSDMIAAPPDMMSNVLAQIAEEGRDKKKEYRNFCYRVWSSVAAALLIVFLLPKLGEIKGESEYPTDTELAMTKWEKSLEKSFFEKLSQENSLFGREVSVEDYINDGGQ